MESYNKYLPDVSAVVHEAIKHLEMLYHRKESIHGIPTGFKKLDKMTAGFQGGDLIVFAGLPSTGKSLICSNMAEHMAVYEARSVAYFSLEMSSIQVVLRMISSMAAIDILKMRAGFLSEDDWCKIKAAGNSLTASKIHFDDAPAQTVYDIRWKAILRKAKAGLDILFIDDLGLIMEHRQPENRTHEIREIIRCLKDLARELNIPVVVTSKLMKKGKGPLGKQPQEVNFGEFGAIEQFADLVCLVNRKIYDFIEEAGSSSAEIIIVKHRNGPIGKIPLVFSNSFIRFDNP